jgi:hypothetical protein
MWTSERKEPKGSPPFVIIKGKINQFQHFANVQVIVSLGNGFKHRQGYKQYVPDPQMSEWGRPKFHGEHETKGLQILMSMNGPAAMTFEQMGELYAAIEAARESLRPELERWENEGGK